MRRERKKLAEAAALMALGQLRFPHANQDEVTPEDEVTQALAAFGLQVSAPLELEETFALWPECLPTFHFWQSLQTQWTQQPMGGLSHLNYPGVQVCMEMAGIKKRDRKTLFSEIQAMERAVLKADAKQKKQ
jgi:hypothetical protein